MFMRVREACIAIKHRSSGATSWFSCLVSILQTTITDTDNDLVGRILYWDPALSCFEHEVGLSIVTFVFRCTAHRII